MPLPTYTAPPALVTAGTTLAWTQSAPDTPSGDGWACTVYLIGPSEAEVEGAAADNGVDFACELSATASGELTPGAYRWTARATKDTAAHDIATGTFTLLPNPATAENGSGRSFAARMLAQVESRISELLADNIEEYTQGQLQARRRTLDDLENQRARYQAEVQAEQRQGSRPVQAFRVQFARPR